MGKHVPGRYLQSGLKAVCGLAGSLLVLTILFSGQLFAAGDDGGKMTEEAIDPGKAFLARNAKKPGITVTTSGLQYEVIESGEGKTPVEISLNGKRDKAMIEFYSPPTSDL